MKENFFCEHPTYREQDGQLLKDLYPGLQQYCHFLTQNKWDGEDLAQEVISKVWGRYLPISEIKPALLHKIAYNQWIDNVRKKKRDNLMDLERMNEIVDKKASMLGPELVDYLLKGFTPKQAVVFLLKEGFQYQTKEVAEILKTSEESVKAILYRIRNRLLKDSDQHATKLVPYGSEEDNEYLYELLVSSIVDDDPTVLIKAIPKIKSLTSESTTPILLFNQKQATSKYSPSCTLSMAA